MSMYETTSAVILGMLVYDGIKWMIMVGVPKALEKAVRWQSSAINHLRERK
ncbi:MAG: hypothetical protein N0E44_18025 [Candidatus Thiodiazotropha lotti]|nr:hypothetical protein [Candidatus Thiodiazotropha lotti]MCW4221782.1 hypothetical protein [Candidatus Thiodiazotropha lotti]